jgi:hypothetical protein
MEGNFNVIGVSTIGVTCTSYGVLSVNLIGNPPFTYNLTNSYSESQTIVTQLSNYQFTNLTADTYTLIVSDYLGTCEYTDTYVISGLTNWVEDRRIDMFIYKSAPGYREYYTSMYFPAFPDTRIIIVTSSPDPEDQYKTRIYPFVIDYISKPIRPRLLVSKVESLLRRSRGDVQSEKNLSVSGIFVNREKFIVEKKDEQIQLPKKEFELLELLLSKPGKVFTRDEILNLVWGNEAIVGERTIDVHVRKLREKLGDDYIRTIKGVGYTFVDSEK